ncbi:cupredoxin domain-containing protein [Candidatus Pacearchaeota archaeon]|nr:cupredoxin domain-containing protein [Candidatus Pacearchaeota archaeon]
MENGLKGIIAVVMVIVVLFGIHFLTVPKPDNTDILAVEGSFGIDEIGVFGSGVASIPAASEYATYNIEITRREFIPRKLEIKKGDKVIFANKGSSPVWVANSEAENCGTPDEEKIFGDCKELITGEKYSFIFGETGTWNYEDKLNPTKTGTITVR